MNARRLEGITNGSERIEMARTEALGSFPVVGRLHLGNGSDVQIGATQFHRYNHRWILSVRLPF
jgi:hypothetical protein